MTLSFLALHCILNLVTPKKSSVLLKQYPGEAHMTLKELQCLAKHNTWQSLTTKAFRYVKNITGSSAYWNKVQQN